MIPQSPRTENNWRCDHCQHFQPGSESLGQCRRKPPVIINDGGTVSTGTFPVVAIGWWCGEYQN